MYNDVKYPFTLPDLPYKDDALTPHITPETIGYHYGKHHNTYVNNLNNLVKETPYESMTLVEIIQDTARDENKTAIFNNAAQIWNHTFYWHSMKPNGGGKPQGKLADMIDTSFGSFEQMVEQFKNAAMSQFGSGWAWLVLDNGTLKITKTGNADLPMIHNQLALLTIDVWEHAYYIDHRNLRAQYVNAFFAHLVNWQFAELNFVD